MQGAYIKKKERRSREEQTCKLIFGLGALPTFNSKFSLLPAGFGGLYKAAIAEEEYNIKLKEKLANEDITSEEFFV